MPQIRFWQVDAFTDRAFSGNPAAVFLLDDERDTDWMRAVANETNLADTAFVRRSQDGYSLRWFTPAAEVDLCGHATLAAAHVLWSIDMEDASQAIRFDTRCGRLTASRDGDFIELDFPALPATPVEAPAALAEGLGTPIEFVARSRFDYLAVLDSAARVRALRPDFRKLRELETRGVIVTAPSDDARYDFQSRFFAPAVGVDEDPVCGSAHCCLATYWSARTGKTRFTAYQASARGGVLRVRHAGDRVALAGQAVTVWSGAMA